MDRYDDRYDDHDPYHRENPYADLDGAITILKVGLIVMVLIPPCGIGFAYAMYVFPWFGALVRAIGRALHLD